MCPALHPQPTVTHSPTQHGRGNVSHGQVNSAPRDPEVPGWAAQAAHPWSSLWSTLFPSESPKWPGTQQDSSDSALCKAGGGKPQGPEAHLHTAIEPGALFLKSHTNCTFFSVIQTSLLCS